MQINGLQDKRNIFMLLGCYLNDPSLMKNENYSSNQNYFPDVFHKIIYGASLNITKKSNVRDISAFEIENEISQFNDTMDIWKSNDGFTYVESAKEETKDKLHNVGLYLDNVRKYAIVREGIEKLKIDVSFLYNENDRAISERFNQLTSNEVLRELYNKFDEYKSLWKDEFSDSYKFHAGDGLSEIIENCKDQSDTYGLPFQNQYLNTIFRGKKRKKFLMFSSKSGGGKSRSMIGETGNITCEKMYDWNKDEWISLGFNSSALYISTELNSDEIQTALLSFVSGIDEDRIIEWRDITEEEEKIIIESKEVIEQSLFYGVYMPDFDIDLISETVEQYVINKNIGTLTFDYLNDSISMYNNYMKKTSGIRLQTHQVLYLVTEELKLLCNKFNIHLRSATQLSTGYKNDKDNSALKGSSSIDQKLDGGIISLPVKQADLKKIEHVLSKRFFKIPNFAHYIYKNRGNKWNNLIVWSNVNLGTCREEGLFCTTMDYEYISDIEKTNIGDIHLTLEQNKLIDDPHDSMNFDDYVKQYNANVNKTDMSNE